MFEDEPGRWYGSNSFPFLACMGPKHASMDTCMYIFSSHFGELEHVFEVQI